MIRAVMDTNVLASGFAAFESLESTPGAIVDRWYARQFELVISTHILTELRRTLDKPYFASHRSSAQITASFNSLARIATVVVPSVTIAGVAPHPEDDAVLAAAVTAQVDYLVTGDKQLQQLGSYQGVSIVAPRQFLTLLEQDEPIR